MTRDFFIMLGLTIGLGIVVIAWPSARAIVLESILHPLRPSKIRFGPGRKIAINSDDE